MDRVLIYRDDGRLRISAGTRSDEIEVHAGDVRWEAAGELYTVENLTDLPVRIAEIELKGPPAGALPAVKLDPAVVDATHYKVEFENDRVRVLHVHYGPHEKGLLHEHVLNRVVLYMNDQGNFKAGDMRVAGAATHTEQNAGDEPADRIAVELK